jgi:dimethylaniline monooxygenase (N-oxide forming)
VPHKNHANPLRVAVIGAGASGLCSVKALKEVGFSPECFEMGTLVGGLWAIKNENGRGGAYESLHINTSTKAMEFSDFPMRTDIGDFPLHSHIAEYFAEYAAHFDLIRHIRFRKEVVKCTPRVGGYDLTLREPSGEVSTAHFEAVIVANGHHWSPAFPPQITFDGFTGHVTHATHYRNPRSPHDYSSDRVLVVGMGNSAMDLACELSSDENSKSVSVAARRGAWVLPKYILGKPLDQGRVIPMWLPSKLRRRLVTKSFEMICGSMEDYGLPRPDHLIGEAHPTVSSEFPKLVKEGRITMRTGFVSARDDVVAFSDGSTGQFDAIIFCTGYNVEFPFFDAEHVAAPDNRLPLYHRAFHLLHRRLFFVGLAQTVGAIMPVAELQARAIALHLAGRYNLPSIEVMQKTVTEEERKMAERFTASRRHTMQVIPEHFKHRIEKDLRAGRRRAASGNGIAFPGREREE